MARIRLTERRRMLQAARDKATEKVVAEIKPAFRQMQNRIKRYLRANGNLRKRMMRIRAISAHDRAAKFLRVADFHSRRPLVKQDQPDQPSANEQDWLNWKTVLAAAILAGLLNGGDDLIDVEDQVWTSRGGVTVTYDQDQMTEDMKRRLGATVDAVVQSTQNQLQNALGDWFGGDEEFSSLMDDIDTIFGDARIDTIGRTSVGDYLSQIILHTMLGNDWKQWYWDAFGENPCTTPIIINGDEYQGCADLNGRLFDIGTPMPPDAAHPNCQCLPTPKTD